jgi:hypothetical protein
MWMLVKCSENIYIGSQNMLWEVDEIMLGGPPKTQASKATSPSHKNPPLEAV